MPPEEVPVLGHDPGQHPLRPAGGDPGRGRGRRPGRRGRPGHRRPARRLRHPGRGAGRPAGRRGAPAGRLRPGLDRRPGPADPGRGHQQPGRGQRGPHHRRPPAATLGPDHHHHRPPAVHHRPGRPDRGGLRRPHRRGRHAGRAPRPWRPLRRPVRPLGRRRRLSRGGGRPHPADTRRRASGRKGRGGVERVTPSSSSPPRCGRPGLIRRSRCGSGWAGCSRRCSR
jgi:hypothetical protein